MFRNYFKTAWRNLAKNKFYSLLNITGLAIGLAVGIMILMWVKNEKSYDKFHSNSENIYSVISQITIGGEDRAFDYVPGSVAPFSVREIPGVEKAVRYTENYDYNLLKYQDKEFTEKRMAYVDPNFFTVFDFNLVKGNNSKPFPDNNSIIITASTAKKYFGEQEPVGKIIQVDNKVNFSVAGVVRDFPDNSSIQFDILFPFDILIKRFEPNEVWKSLETDWGNYDYVTYLLISPGTDVKSVADKLTQLQRKHNKFDKGSTYALQPLHKKHLYGPDGNSSAMQLVNVFFLVAILMLLIAGINYVNLSTARAMLRSKEVSIRKMVGAARIQLFLQFIYETAILFIISSVLAFVIIYVSMPIYNQVSGKTLSFDLSDPQLWTTIGATIFFTLILASLYPALLLSSFKPLQALKGKLSFGIGNALFRKILVTSQFMFSIALIIGTIVIGRQLNYVREKELGYDKENVFAFPMDNMETRYSTLKTELMNQPGVIAVSGSNQDLINSASLTGDTDWDGKGEKRMFMIHPIGIDEHFISLFKLELLEGEQFKGVRSTDSTKFILNETAVREAGIKDPIGKRFKLWDTQGIIAGVVKDFHFTSLKRKIEPAIFYYNDINRLLYVKTTGRDASTAIASAKKLWTASNPGFPFEYNFLDESYDRLYRSDQRTGKLFQVFSLIAIAISCLGLLGLATYTAQVKTKEIGIRKVLGASVPNIVGLLSREFIRLVLIALLLASPVAWYFMNEWLKDFAYRISINWTVFFFAGILAIAIAILTISFQAIRAAIVNPVKSLRTE